MKELTDAIELVPYDPSWPSMAEQEINLIRDHFSANDMIDIQHVGSTAIPGMIAKPIIDIQISVQSLSSIKQKAIDVLEKLGYAYWKDNPDTERMFFVKGMPPFGKKRTHHVHIVEPISRHWREKIAFRDYLINHSEAAHEYEKIKKELAVQHQYDREKYTDAKTKFINEILSVALSTNAENYIIQSFQDYNIIGLGEGGHHLENAHQFFHKLLDNKKFQEIIDIIILEFANTDYQETLDKFIFGDEVDEIEIRKIWRESTQSAGLFGEASIYFELLKKIRDINLTLPQDKKIRVLGGDPSINWKSINNIDDWKSQVGCLRETFPADLAVEFGIKKNKKVLIIYSEFHLTKIPDKQSHSDCPTITSFINEKHPNSMKSVGIVYLKELLSQKIFENIPMYSVVDLFNDELGNLPAAQFFHAGIFQNGKELTLFYKYKLKDIFDAVMYVGSYDLLKRYPMHNASNFDKNAFNELNRRRKILGWETLDEK